MIISFDPEIKATRTEINTPKLEHIKLFELFAHFHNYLRAV